MTSTLLLERAGTEIRSLKSRQNLHKISYESNCGEDQSEDK